jgi:hypothetical protein
MHKIATAVLAAGLALGLGEAAPATESSARPSPIMAAFQDYCVKYGGRQLDIMDAIDRAGDYLPAPPDLAAAMMRSKNATGMARIKRIGGQTLVLMTFTTKGQDFGLDGPVQSALVDGCMVSLTTRSPGLPAEVAAWLGPDVPGQDGAYAFIQGPSGPEAPKDDSDEAFVAAARAGTLRLVTVEDAPKESSLVLGALRLPAALSQGADASAMGAPFNDFKAVCIDTKADPAAVAAASAQGWMPMPVKDLELPYPMKTGEVRVKSTEDEFELLFNGAGRMQIGLKVLNMTYCAVAQAPPNDTLLMKSAEDWVGVPPVEIDPGGSRIYIFTEKDGVHTTLGSNLEAALAKAMKAGPVWVAVLERSSSTSGHSIVAFGRLTKVADF